jgi:Domain of unknown function (DUF6471)
MIARFAFPELASLVGVQSEAATARAMRLALGVRPAGGLKETEASVANKISRGTFAATFFLATLVAIGCEAITLEDL